MLLLVPASVVTVAAALRSAWILRDSNLKRLASELPEADGAARSEASYSAALQLYGTLQPLTAVYILAPLVGLAGSFSGLIMLSANMSEPGMRQLQQLARSYQAALIPPFWGVTIAAVSYAAFAILRARIFRAETELFR